MGGAAPGENAGDRGARAPDYPVPKNRALRPVDSEEPAGRRPQRSAHHSAPAASQGRPRARHPVAALGVEGRGGSSSRECREPKPERECCEPRPSRECREPIPSREPRSSPRERSSPKSTGERREPSEPRLPKELRPPRSKGSGVGGSSESRRPYRRFGAISTSKDSRRSSSSERRDQSSERLDQSSERLDHASSSSESSQCAVCGRPGAQVGAAAVPGRAGRGGGAWGRGAAAGIWGRGAATWDRGAAAAGI